MGASNSRARALCVTVYRTSHVAAAAAAVAAANAVVCRALGRAAPTPEEVCGPCYLVGLAFVNSVGPVHGSVSFHSYACCCFATVCVCLSARGTCKRDRGVPVRERCLPDHHSVPSLQYVRRAALYRTECMVYGGQAHSHTVFACSVHPPFSFSHFPSLAPTCTLTCLIHGRRTRTRAHAPMRTFRGH